MFSKIRITNSSKMWIPGQINDGNTMAITRKKINRHKNRKYIFNSRANQAIRLRSRTSAHKITRNKKKKIAACRGTERGK